MCKGNSPILHLDPSCSWLLGFSYMVDAFGVHVYIYTCMYVCMYVQVHVHIYVVGNPETSFCLYGLKLMADCT